MLFAILAISALATCHGVSSVNLYDDSNCATLSDSFNITKLTNTCQRQDTDGGVRSVVISSVKCDETTGVSYSFTVCGSADCTGTCNSQGTVSFTTSDYVKYLAGLCTVQTVRSAEQYLKIVGTPLDFCSSSAIVVPSMLLSVLVFIRTWAL
jgi:hypothetical protein